MRKFGILKVLDGGVLLAGGAALAGAMFQLGRLSMAVDTIGLCISRDGEDDMSDAKAEEPKSEEAPKEGPEEEPKAEKPAEAGACGNSEDGEFSLDEEALAAAMLEMSEPGEYL